MKMRAFKAALPYTLPICIGFLALGLSYAEQRVFLALPPVYESLDLCRIHGVRHHQSAVRRFSAAPCFFC